MSYGITAINENNTPKLDIMVIDSTLGIIPINIKGIEIIQITIAIILKKCT